MREAEMLVRWATQMLIEAQQILQAEGARDSAQALHTATTSLIELRDTLRASAVSLSLRDEVANLILDTGSESAFGSVEEVKSLAAEIIALVREHKEG